MMYLGLGLALVVVRSPPVPQLTAEPLAAADAGEPSGLADPVQPPAVALADPRQVAAAIAAVPGPTLAEIQSAAMRRASLNPRRTASWLRRARSAGVLPELQAGWDRRTDEGWRVDREADTGDELTQDVAGANTFRVRVTWDLDRLIFDDDELKVARTAMDLADWRERVLVEVTQLHFERVRLVAGLQLMPPRDLAEMLDITLRIREVEGVLAGLTGLAWFSDHHNSASVAR